MTGLKQKETSLVYQSLYSLIKVVDVTNPTSH